MLSYVNFEALSWVTCAVDMLCTVSRAKFRTARHYYNDEGATDEVKTKAEDTTELVAAL